MMNIVGLGGAGSAIAKQFEKYPQYSVYYVDSGIKKTKNTFPITERNTHEEYDKKQIRMTRFVNSMSDSQNCLLIMAGSGDVSGASLQVLKFLSRRFTVDVLYVKPDHELLGRNSYLQDRICYSILQEYARSGAIHKMCLVSNIFLEEILKDSLTTENYFDKINELVCYTYHMVNVFDRTKPILDNMVENPEHSRIYTLGLVDYETGEEKMFFPLDEPENKCYYYAVSNKELKEDYRALKNISKKVKNRTDPGLEPSYQIHSTVYDTNYAFSTFWVSKIQTFPEGVEE
jgi:hypothetical protein